MYEDPVLLLHSIPCCLEVDRNVIFVLGKIAEGCVGVKLLRDLFWIL